MVDTVQKFPRAEDETFRYVAPEKTLGLDSGMEFANPVSSLLVPEDSAGRAAAGELAADELPQYSYLPVSLDPE